MKKDLIIFGNGKIADIVYYYAKNECHYNVVAFTTDKEYIKEGLFNGLPVTPFEEIESLYKPEDHDMFVAIGYQDLNRLRERKYNEAKAMGYELVNVISPNVYLPGNVKIGD
ncbi:MAG: transferase, partial [Ferruginibacter sp.]|nr:transferase [Ferruginibacter sp.]